MIWLYLILAVLTLLVILILSPLHLVIVYNEHEGFKVKLRMLGLSFSPYSRPPLDKREKTEKKGKPKNTGFISGTIAKRGFVDSLRLFLKILNLSGKMLKKAIKGINLNKLKINISVGASDAASAAIKYGQVSSLLYPLAAIVTSLTAPKEYSVNVNPDFLSGKISSDLQLDINARVFYIIFIFLIFAKKYSELI